MKKRDKYLDYLNNIVEYDGYLLDKYLDQKLDDYNLNILRNSVPNFINKDVAEGYGNPALYG